MAEQILISVAAEELLKKVISLASEEISHAWGFKGELRKLNNTFATIQEVLRDAERKKVTDGAVKLWLERLKDVAYDADDLLDEISYESLRYKIEIQIRMKNKVRNFFSPSNPLAFRFKMTQKIMNINGILDEIARDKDRFQFRAENRDAVDHILENRKLRETDCNVNDSGIFGRENEKSKIVDMLISSSNQENVSVLPIVGMGGLGKTTLVQLVYNDTRVEQYFDSRIWVCVSDDFDVNRLLRKIIGFLEKDRCKDLSMTVLVQKLQRNLSGKRFLTVLDDVWNEDNGKWCSLQSSLESIGATRGNQILVTTRSVQVATIMGTLPMHILVGLSDDDCWRVFKRRAFWIGGAKETPNLEKIGREIMKKCKGVPLAAMTLGGLMRSKKDESDWLSVRNSAILDLREDKNGIFPALKLSYDHLPAHLKQCFSYCSIFPKDYKIHKDRLIRLWMAQGYLQPSKGSKLQMEEVGDEYFNILWWNSFFQDVEIEEKVFDTDHCTSQIICKMHDLVHDLAASIRELNAQYTRRLIR